MKKAKNFFSRLLEVFSVVIFLFGLFVFVSVLNASSGKVPAIFGYSFLQVQSGSMEPEYPIGTVVIAKKVDVNSLEVGDVISFYSTDKDISGQVNTHRIEEITSNMKGVPVFITKGDANANADSMPVSSVNVIGKVVYNIGTAGGTVLSVLKNPKIIFFFIVLPLIFITFGEAINLATLIAKSKFDKEEDDDEKPSEK